MASDDRAENPEPDNTGVEKRDWVFTLNNYTPEEFDYLKNGKLADSVKYLVFGVETAPTTGTPHLQGYVYFHNAKPKSAVKKILKSKRFYLDWRRSKTIEKAIEYAKKDGNFIERGVAPMTQEEKGACTKRRWTQTIDLAKQGRFSEIDPMLQVTQFANLRKIYEDKKRAEAHETLNELDNYWFWGPSGTGKSRLARELWPEHYAKLANKWWCGYKMEDTVLIEDFDLNHSVLGYHVKIWGDRYPFPVENKGGGLTVRPRRLVITSNWHPNQIWTQSNDLQPIERRFKIVEFPLGEGVIDELREKYKKVVDTVDLTEETESPPIDPPQQEVWEVNTVSTLGYSDLLHVWDD